MQKICSKALLLTDVESFGQAYKEIAESCEVDLRIESTWKPNYRVSEDVIICGSKYLELINASYYSNIVLILRAEEKPFEFVNKGVTRFIFNHNDTRELAFALVKRDKIYIKETTKDIKEITKDSTSLKYCLGDYEFHFDTNIFKWRGNGIYLTKQTVNYLADWLLNGHKDNAKRIILFNVRKRLGADFLKDVDRHGNLK